jgi:hypothetical protein
MARRLRIAAFCMVGAALGLLVILGGAYRAAQHVRPFYEQALKTEHEVLQRGSRELESRATALFSDARQAGQWQAVFTADQINGWLALQLDEFREGSELPDRIRDPRVAIAPELLTLGFRTSSGGVETVVSVDAGVVLTEKGAVAIRLMSVRAGALPLPVMQLADEIAAACRELSLPVRWTQQAGKPVAIVELHSDESTGKREFHIDEIKLGEGELYVSGHTDVAGASEVASRKAARSPDGECTQIALDEFELRLTPHNDSSALEVARRPKERRPAEGVNPTER